MEFILLKTYQKALDELDQNTGKRSKENDIRALVDLAEQIRKDGNYSESVMLEIIKKLDERIKRT